MKKFTGNLKKIDPHKLVTEDKFNRAESFFLGLGVILNDLKSLILFEKMLVETYESPKIGEVSDHVGNYMGVIVYWTKLITSTINEFFIFLKAYSDVYSKSEFINVKSQLSKPYQKYWDSIISTALNKGVKSPEFTKKILIIRNNIGFHYDHSGKSLRNSYISRFFGKSNDEGSKYAWYSIGKAIKDTRFYFADAVVAEMLQIAAGKKVKAKSVDDPKMKKFRTDVIEAIEVMNVLITDLLKVYIQKRRNRQN